ncbi:MAG: GNAT family N-acetyltransferase [Gilvibacter sp.]
MIIQTQNLYLREAHSKDAAFILQLVNTPTWLQHIGDRNVHSIEEAQEFIQSRLVHSYKTHGYGLYVVLLKDHQIPIGLFGFVKRDYLDHPDIGFALLPNYTGQGYGKEAANASMEYGVNQLGFPVVLGITSQENIVSQRLLARLGLQNVGLITPPEESKPLVLFKLDVSKNND